MRTNFVEPPLALANSAAPAVLVLDNATALDDDGWALIAPFGRHPKTRVFTEGGQVKQQQFIQVLDDESADAMVGKENSFFGKLKRAVVGIPIFKGHGDLKDHDPKAIGNEQKSKLGVVDRIRKAARGIEAHFALDNDGASAVGAGWKLPSALWLVQLIGNEVQPDGQTAILARPFKLLSVALTPFPNIPGVEALANQAQAVHGQAQAVPEPTLPPPPEPTLKAESNPQNKAKTNEIMKSKLLGCDPQNVSQARAAAVFRAEVMRLVNEQKMTLDAAWAQVKATEPDLAARMSERPAGEAVANSAPAPAPLAQKAFTAMAFQLPMDVDDSVFEAAWRANGNQSVRANFKKIFMGLVVFIASKQGVSVAVARRQVQDDYPNLARAAGEALAPDTKQPTAMPPNIYS